MTRWVEIGALCGFGEVGLAECERDGFVGDECEVFGMEGDPVD